MYTRYRFRALAHSVVIGMLVATGSNLAAAAPVSGPNITEPRNAATGFAITSWMIAVDALGNHCSKLGSPSDVQFADALKAWQGRNAPYVNAALEYMADIEDFVQAKQGEAARAGFRDNRNAEFAASTRKAEAVWFPDHSVDEASCRRMANRYADGSLDLDRSSEFFPILQTLKAEAETKGTK